MFANHWAHWMIGIGIASAPLCVAIAGEEALRESFSAPIGEIPPGWERFDASDKRPASAPPQIAAVEKGEGLKFERISRAWDNSAVFHTARSFTDFSGSVVIRRQGLTTSQCIGLGLRAQRAGYRFNGYYITIRYTGKLRGISISENPQDYSESGEERAFAPFPQNLVSGKDYLLRFSAVGRVLKASLWEKAADVQLGKEAVFDQADGHLSGFFGFRSGFSGGDDEKPIFIRDLEIIPVSESK